jgi:acetoin utilization protein AcuB
MTTNSRLKVRGFMTSNPQTIRPNDMLAAARDKMVAGRFRRLPVVDDAGQLLGILTDGDLREHVGYLAGTKVTAAMVEQPITIAADAPIDVAADLMLAHKIGGLPVVESDGQLVGIITETDLLRGWLHDLRGPHATPSGD